MNIFKNRKAVIQDPPPAQWLFTNKWASLIWLPLRLYLGYQWLHAFAGKYTNPAWVQTGEALKGFWMKAIAIPESGRPAISFDWYRSFLTTLIDAEAYTWFAKLVVAGELLVGICLILGAFTGIAAFFGGFMNWNFMMAGSASTNPMLFVISVGLILAWKVAGYIGLDYVLLPLVGTPWQWKKPQLAGGAVPEGAVASKAAAD